MKVKLLSSFGLTFLSSGIFFAFNFFIAKFLGANIYGEITYYISFVQIIGLLVSLNYAALYMGNKITKDDPNTFSLFFSLETILFIVISIPAYIIIDTYIKDSTITLLVLSIAYLLTISVLIGLEYNAKKEVVYSIIYASLMPRVLMVGLFLCMIVLGDMTAQSYLYIYLISLGIVVGYFLIQYRPVLYIKSRIFQRAWKFYLLGIIGQSTTYIAQIYQKEYGDYMELASLAIGMLLISGLSLVGGVLVKFVLPQIHQAWKDKNIQRIEHIYQTHTFVSNMINLPILIFLLFYISSISAYMGNGYINLPIILYILSIGYLFDILTGITGTLLRSTEYEHLEIYNEIFRFITAIWLIILLKDVDNGVVIAVSISAVVYNIVKYFQLYRLFKILPMVKESLFKLLTSLLVLICVLYIVTSYSDMIFLGFLILAIYFYKIYYILKSTIDFRIYQ